MPLETSKAIKTELDAIAKNRLSAEVGSDGRLTGAISTTRKGITFTGYVKALVKGQKNVEAGFRMEKEF